MSASLTGTPSSSPSLKTITPLVAPPGVRKELATAVSLPSAPTLDPAAKTVKPVNPLLARFNDKPKPLPNILIVGESGWGKTRSMKNMPWDRTAFVDTEGKGFEWSDRVPSAHLFRMVDAVPEEVLAVIDALKDDDRFDYIVIDSFTGFNSRAYAYCTTKYNGYELYAKNSEYIAQFLARCTSVKKRIIVTAIPEMLTTESSGNTVGVLIKRASVIGRAMEGRVEPAFAYAVFLRQTTVPGQRPKHEFVLSSDVKSQAKIPEGVFRANEMAMENDTYELIKRIEAAERAGK